MYENENANANEHAHVQERKIEIKIKAAVDIFLGTAMLLAERYDLAKIPTTELACAVRA